MTSLLLGYLIFVMKLNFNTINASIYWWQSRPLNFKLISWTPRVYKKVLPSDNRLKLKKISYKIGKLSF